MPRVSAAPLPQSGVARLVEAERAWQVSLAEARERARATLERARADAVAREAAGDAATGGAVEARRRELEASVVESAGAVGRELAARTSRYSNASDVLVNELARTIAGRAPWCPAVAEGAK